MNCEEIQAQLSDYLDRSLDGTQKDIVEKHLGACPICREEAELINETMGEVAALPWIDPPLGFTQRVMAQVCDVKTQPGYWQRFSWALRQNLPIQVTALVMIGILGMYLIIKENPQDSSTSLPPPEIKQNPTPPPETLAVAPSESDQIVLAQRALEPSTKEVSPSRAPRPDSAASNEGAKITESGARKSVEGKVPRTSVTASATPSGAAQAAPEPSDRTAPLISGTPVTTHASSPVGGSPVTFSFPFESDTSGAFRSAPAAIEPFADFELIVRRHPRPADEPKSEVAGISRKAEVEKAAAERSSAPRAIDRLMAAIPDHARPQTIWVNVPKDQYEQFKKELHALGIIESEIRVPLLRDQTAAHGDGQVRVRLTAVPTADSSTPNAPANR
jgi:anti-sigma factor RsiW